ncbi:MAG: hypothetical protein AAF687_12915 [Pseudomonadota bacterium]
MEQEFWDRGYLIIEGLLDQGQLDLISAAMNKAEQDDVLRECTVDGIDAAMDQYSPYAGEFLLRHCRERIERHLGRELLDGFAYWRIYQSGGTLLKHIDRAACEISVSLTVEADPEAPAWPLMVVDLQGNERAIELPPGTGIVYQGHKIQHWREPFAGQSQKQLLMSYVLKDGEFADYAFDARGFDPLARDPA